MMLALALLFPILAGFALVSLTCGMAQEPQLASKDVLHFRWAHSLALGGPIGLALFSIVWFTWLVAGGDKLPIGFATLEIVASLLITVVYLGTFWRRRSHQNRTFTTKADQRSLLFLKLAFLLSAFVSLARWVALTYLSPNGAWDAWMIWNVRATFLFRSAPNWMEAFDRYISPWTHLDYPLLLPSMVASGWKFLGHETIAIPIAIAFTFSIATPALLTLAVASLRSHSQALLAGLLLLSIATYCTWGAAQMADVPLAFFFLGATACLLFSVQNNKLETRLFLLAALCCGLAAWLKNEGMLFAVYFTVCTFVTLASRRILRWQDALSFVVVLLPFVILLFYFKTFVAPPSDFLTQSPNVILYKLDDSSRYVFIAKAFIKEGLGFGWPLIPMIAYGAFALSIKQRSQSPASSAALTALLLMLLSFFMIYVISPYQLDNHVRDSLSRLILQLYPAAILLYCYFIATPEELFAEASNQETG
jgi:hypothetical protein